MQSTNSISTLNDLIATTLDSVDGYRKAAENADQARYRDMFTDFASQREEAARALQAQVRASGGEPEDDGTVLAAAHRAFLTLKDAVTGRDDKAIIDEVERGEDHIKAKYEAAMRKDDLDAGARSAIEQAYGSVRMGHDRMRDLKHSLEGRDGASDTAGTTGGSPIASDYPADTGVGTGTSGIGSGLGGGSSTYGDGSASDAGRPSYESGDTGGSRSGY